MPDGLSLVNLWIRQVEIVKFSPKFYVICFEKCKIFVIQQMNRALLPKNIKMSDHKCQLPKEHYQRRVNPK